MYARPASLGRRPLSWGPAPVRHRLGDLPAGTPYTPTLAEAQNADAYLPGLGRTRAPGAWSLGSNGVFWVPTTDGNYITFGWGRGDFAAFPGPGQAAPAAAAAAPVAPAVDVAPVTPALPAAGSAAAVPVAATVADAAGTATPVTAVLQTSATPALEALEATPAAGPGFTFQDFLTGLLQAPALQAPLAQAQAALQPVAQQVGLALVKQWVAAHKTELLIGAGVAGLGLVLLVRGRR